MKSLAKSVVLSVTVLSFILYFIPNVFCDDFSEALLFPVEISGKILNKDGAPFTESVTVAITANIAKDASEIDYTGDRQKHVEYKQAFTGGTFSWKGQAWNVDIKAEKEGFHSSL